MALVVVSMFLFVVTFILGTIFVVIILGDIDNTPNDGIAMLLVFPILIYITSGILFKTWYDFDRKKKGIPLR